jgi:hypothetical protein
MIRSSLFYFSHPSPPHPNPLPPGERELIEVFLISSSPPTPPPQGDGEKVNKGFFASLYKLITIVTSTFLFKILLVEE